MTKDEALRLAMDWYGSGNQDPDEFERLILSIVAQREQDGECKYCTDGCPACDARKLPEQEPVAFVKGWNCGRLEVIVRSLNQRFEIDQPLYTTPPQRKWVGLTDEEMQDLWDRYAHMEMMRAIEAKLKEKNT